MLANGYTYSVLIVSSAPKVTASICELLSPSSFAPIISITSGAEARQLMISSHFDIIIINTPLHDEFGSDFAIDMAQATESGILMLVKYEHYEQVSFKAENVGILTVTSPISRPAMYQAIKLLIATRERLRRLEEKFESLQVKMMEIRVVNRAKWALINALNMSEPQAHRYIEKQAMDTRRTRSEVAECILKTYKQ